MFLSQVAVFQPFNPAFQFRARFLHPRDGPIKPSSRSAARSATIPPGAPFTPWSVWLLARVMV